MKAKARVVVTPKKSKTNGRTRWCRTRVAKPFMIIFMMLRPFLGSNTPFRLRQHRTSNLLPCRTRQRSVRSTSKVSQHLTNCLLASIDRAARNSEIYGISINVRPEHAREHKN